MIFSRIKKGLLTLLLIAVYYLLFGFFLIGFALFQRKRLWPKIEGDSYWLDAQGYAEDINESMRQS